MRTLDGTLRRLASDLERLGVPWALIGGLAVGTRAEPRTTRDVDVVVSVAAQAERLAWLRSTALPKKKRGLPKRSTGYPKRGQLRLS
jgi:hypothetical protein